MTNSTYLINGDYNQTISPLDRGFAYGDGVFRTIRMKKSLPTNWHLHYQKLVADCAAINIVCPSADLLMNDMQQLFYVETINQETSVAKIIITRGEGVRGYATPAITTPLRVVIRSAMREYHANNYTEGVELFRCETRLAAQPKLAGIKHLNRLENVMARMEWRNEQLFDGLLLDQQDHVIECTMSNIFARFGQQLITPELSRCGVAGITRLQILALSKSLNLDIQESNLPISQLLEADEVIICNSLYGVFQVRKIDNMTWRKQMLAHEIRKILKYEEPL